MSSDKGLGNIDKELKKEDKLTNETKEIDKKKKKRFHFLHKRSESGSTLASTSTTETSGSRGSDKFGLVSGIEKMGLYPITSERKQLFQQDHDAGIKVLTQAMKISDVSNEAMQSKEVNPEEFKKYYNTVNTFVEKARRYSHRASGDLATKKPPEKILEEHQEAYEKLSTMTDQLKSLRLTAYKKVVRVSADQMDCAPRSTLKSAHPDWSKDDIENATAAARKHMVDFGIVKEGEMIDLNKEIPETDGMLQGQVLMEFFWNNEYIDRNRGLTIYQDTYSEDIFPRETQLVAGSGTNDDPIYVYLDPNAPHFDAMLEED